MNSSRRRARKGLPPPTRSGPPVRKPTAAVVTHGDPRTLLAVVADHPASQSDLVQHRDQIGADLKILRGDARHYDQFVTRLKGRVRLHHDLTVCPTDEEIAFAAALCIAPGAHHVVLRLEAEPIHHRLRRGHLPPYEN